MHHAQFDNEETAVWQVIDNTRAPWEGGRWHGLSLYGAPLTDMRPLKCHVDNLQKSHFGL